MCFQFKENVQTKMQIFIQDPHICYTTKKKIHSNFISQFKHSHENTLINSCI